MTGQRLENQLVTRLSPATGGNDVTSIRHDYLREGKVVSMGHGNGPE
jgi:hypothetical protein